MADLRRRLAQDLDGAFPALVDAHGAMVLAIARRLGDRAAAEDVVQDTFVAAYRALAGYDPDRIAALRLRPWLATIARNRVRNEHRRRSRRPEAPLAAAGDLGAPDVEVAAVGDDAGLVRLLDGLTEAQRAAVVLRHVAGLTTTEVAEVLGCPRATAASHLRRGLAALRRAMGDEGGTT